MRAVGRSQATLEFDPRLLEQSRRVRSEVGAEKIGHVRDGYWLEDLCALLERRGFRVDSHTYYTGRLASLGCRLHYRSESAYARRVPGKLRLVLAPGWRLVGHLGERRVTRTDAASLAVIATRV